MTDKVVLSSLKKTWILDLDGTIVKHNGYKIDGKDTILPNAEELLSQIEDGDLVIFVTSRKKDMQKETETFLKKQGIRYDHIIFEAPYGERIIVNDRKPSGLNMAVAMNLSRDLADIPQIVIDETL